MQTQFAKTLLSSALSLALFGAVGAAQAQEQAQAQPAATPAQSNAQSSDQTQGNASQAGPAKTLGAVNVSGSYRSSIQFSTDAKRDATNVTDSVFAEDIGKFPDTNIAESLTRVPGVQLTRDVDGEGVNIQIRGLGTDFTKIMLNGDQLAVASAGGLNSQNQNREVDLDLLPTEFFTQLTVNKTPTPGMTEGGIAGVVDMRTTRPFDNPGTHLTYSAQGSYNSIGSDIKPRGSLIGSWTNASNTFGAVVGITGARNDYDVRGFETIGWTTPQLNAAQCGTASGGCSPAGGSWIIPKTVPAGAGLGLAAGQTIDNAWLLAHNPGLTTSQIANALIPRLGRDAYVDGTNDHQSAMASLEWRPSDAAHFYLDTLFSQKERHFDRLDMNLIGRSGQMIPTNMQVDQNNVVTQADFANAQYFLESRPYDQHTKFYNINPGGEFLFGSNQNMKLDFQGYVQRSWYRQYAPSIDVQSPLGQNITVNYANTGGNYPTISPSANLNDPNLGWGYYRVNIQNETRTTENKGTREDFQWGDDSNNLRVGVAYDDISREIKAYDNSSAWANVVQATVPANGWPQYVKPGPDGFIAVDYAALMAATNYDYLNATAPLTTAAASGANAGNIEEKTWAWYLEGNGKFDLGGHELRVNGGVRHASTDQTIAGPSTIGTQLEYITLKNSYDYYLPSLNLAFNAADDVVLRLAASRSLTRPDPSAMVPNTNFSDPSAETATQGNPKLAPYLSTNLDLGGEWYTGHEGYVALDLFGKRIKGFTVSGTNLIPFSQLGIPYSALTATQQQAIDLRGGPSAAQVQVQQQVNADGTLLIKGAEANWVQPLDFIVKGLGVQANYTVTSQKSVGSGVAAQAIGISPHTYNLTGYWEGYNTMVRLSYTWNSAQISSTANQNGLPFAQIKTDARGQLDLSASYQFVDVMSKPMITLNVINMTKQNFRQTLTYDNAAYTYYTPGYTIMLGVRGTF
ncbi:TonB-dependent receptor [Dyella sp. EPa41]|uniref:TonB-dependent receptor n=1 Tax=Dyella sp. EPa41 TaxID=1561194 RepID=UPI001915FEA5|nr:TonB-dependent receptor [Dyella sp. EPa41]